MRSRDRRRRGLARGQALGPADAPAATSEQNVRSLRALYAAFARRDLPAILDFLAPGVVWEEPSGLGPMAGVWRGHEEVMEALEHTPAELWRLETRAEELLPSGDQVVVLGHHRGRSVLDGADYAIAFAHVWSFRGAYVARFRSFTDAELMRRHVLGATRTSS